MKKHSAFRIVSILIIATLFLSACADTGDGYSTDEATNDEYATEAPATDGSGDAPSSAPGEVVYDLGFTVEQNGFSFENYGGDIPATNLTEVEMRRMFGDQVCAQVNGDQCILTPPAQQWMEQQNDSMSGGHCEGMAVLSLMMYTNQISPSDFGGSVASDLDINDEALQREIAYWFTTQATDPTQSSVIRGTPMEILDYIEKMDANGETYTIGIYKEDFSGGHAITPIGVEDKGDGLYAVLVYDNNYPGQTRELYIDSRDNSWTYEAAINPQVESEVYSGNADTGTLDLTPTSSRLGQQQCSFCGGSSNSSTGGGKFAVVGQSFNEIYLDGEGHILITDNDGNRLGYVDGKIVNEIPGASYSAYRMGASGNAPEPVYTIPADMDVTVEINGSTLTEESLTDLVMIGAGFSIGVEGIYLEPGQIDTAYFYPSEETIAYETKADESPNIVIGVENPDAEADYYFEVQGADIQGGGIITVYLDTKAGDLLINAEKLNNEGSFDFYLTRITDEVEDEFAAEEILLNEGAVVYVNYAEWTDANPEGMYFGVDLDGDGVVDDEYVVDDKQ
jgi:hypothetical protein